MARPDTPDRQLDALHRALRDLVGFDKVARADLVHLDVPGRVHDHIRLGDVRIGGHGVLARIARLSHFDLDPAANLAYQAACFERARPSLHTPCLHAVIAPEPDLPYGALLVEEVNGHPPRLPADMAALADALAAVHILAVPTPAARPPLADPASPIAGILETILRQAASLDAAGLTGDARRQIDEELDWARRFAGETHAPQPATLCLTDTHPGNFLVTADGRAVFVDLEKALYGAPGIDLAHCSLSSSTQWDPRIDTVLTAPEITEFYQRWMGRVPPELAAAVRPWFLPLRRLTWLRTLSWCAHWKATTANHDAGIYARIDRFLGAETLHEMRAEWLGPDPLRFE